MISGIRHTAILVLESILITLMISCEVTPDPTRSTPNPFFNTFTDDKQPFRKPDSTVVVNLNIDSVGNQEQPSRLPSHFLPDKPKYPRLDSKLNQLVEQIGFRNVADIASSAPISTGDLVAVTIHISHNATSTVDFLETLGAIVANAGTDYIEAYVPVTVFVPLSERDGVLKVVMITYPETTVTDK